MYTKNGHIDTFDYYQGKSHIYRLPNNPEIQNLPLNNHKTKSYFL